MDPEKKKSKIGVAFGVENVAAPVGATTEFYTLFFEFFETMAVGFPMCCVLFFLLLFYHLFHSPKICTGMFLLRENITENVNN